jgi:hypothetical protein
MKAMKAMKARAAIISLLMPVAFFSGSGIAYADAPSPGDSCPVWHETTTDADGNTMWCNPMMTGTHGFVWQYGGPA